MFKKWCSMRKSPRSPNRGFCGLKRVIYCNEVLYSLIIRALPREHEARVGWRDLSGTHFTVRNFRCLDDDEASFAVAGSHRVGFLHLPWQLEDRLAENEVPEAGLL